MSCMRTDVVERPATEIIYAAVAGRWNSIPDAASRAFAALEAAIPARGRKIYGYWYPPTLEYRACYALVPGDNHERLNLGKAVLPGGSYRRARLKGNGVFKRIPELFATLEQLGGLAQDGRPWLEFYLRHNEVDLFVPVVVGGPLETHVGNHQS